MKILSVISDLVVESIFFADLVATELFEFCKNHFWGNSSVMILLKTDGV